MGWRCVGITHVSYRPEECHDMDPIYRHVLELVLFHDFPALELLSRMGCGFIKARRVFGSRDPRFNMKCRQQERPRAFHKLQQN